MEADEYKEASATYRHYSNLRFAILTVFVVISTALIGVVHGKDATEINARIILLLKIVGLLTALAFSFIEYVIDKHLIEYGNYLKKNFNTSHWADTPTFPFCKKCISKATKLPQILMALFWLFSLFGLREESYNLQKIAEAAFAIHAKLNQGAQGSDLSVLSILPTESEGVDEVELIDKANAQYWRIRVDKRKNAVLSAKSVPIFSLSTACTDTVQGGHEIQLYLKRLGFSPGPIDGVIGPRTTKALKKFQESAGISDSGVADSGTLNTLCHRATARPSESRAATPPGKVSP